MTPLIMRGDNLLLLPLIADNSVDAIVTDPPYGLSKEPDMVEVLHHWMAGDDYQHKGGGFMGKSWDSFVPGPSVWKECLRVLKPGGHLLAFFGTRTQDMGTLAIRLAGFEIRDSIAWVYGSGFPKSHNLEGDWEGWGTAIKPALEPITMARKPFKGTVAANVLAHGTGALNIDGCRVAVEEGGRPLREVAALREDVTYNGNALAGRVDGSLASSKAVGSTDTGRWPANFIHDGSDEVVALFPQAKGQQGAITGAEPSGKTANAFGEFAGRSPSEPRGDTGSAARFFYCAKASRKDRNEGMADPGPQFKHSSTLRDVENAETVSNNHPTVKPTDLMAYLCRLVTPPGGTVLDPFMGSGSTGKAAIREGFDFIGIEMDDAYADIAEARIAHEIAKRGTNES